MKSKKQEKNLIQSRLRDSNTCIEIADKLNMHPEFVNAQDNEGKTILHDCIESLHSTSNLNNLFQIFTAIELSTHVDSSIQDAKGNTALHLMLIFIRDMSTSNTNVHPNILNFANAIISKAGLSGYTTLNKEGYNALHLAAMIKNTQYLSGVGFIRHLLACSNEGLNTLATSGVSALSIAIKHSNHDSVQALLKAGADPYAFKGDENNPMKLAESAYIIQVNTGAINLNLTKVIGNYRQRNLPDSMTKQSRAFSGRRIKEVATVLGQGRRTGGRFTLFPDHIQITIASMVGHQHAFSNEHALKIANDTYTKELERRPLK